MVTAIIVIFVTAVVIGFTVEDDWFVELLVDFTNPLAKIFLLMSILIFKKDKAWFPNKMEG